MKLDSIGRKYNTDKSSKHHNYLVEYEKFFVPIRQSKISLFEIGISHGASALTWIEYFPKGKMAFLDLFKGDHYDKNKGLKEKVIKKLTQLGATVIEGNQFKKQDLLKIATMFPDGLDIIIDDGSHVAEHQQYSMGFLFEQVKPGGFYCIEDLHTKRKNNTKETLTVIKNFLVNGKIESDFISKDLSEKIARNIENCYLTKNNKLAIIKKRK